MAASRARSVRNTLAVPLRSRTIAGTAVTPWLRSSFLTPASNLWAAATALGLHDPRR